MFLPSFHNRYEFVKVTVIYELDEYYGSLKTLVVELEENSSSNVYK